MKILVVDDDCLICENVKSKLQRIGLAGLACQQNPCNYFIMNTAKSQ